VPLVWDASSALISAEQLRGPKRARTLSLPAWPVRSLVPATLPPARPVAKAATAGGKRAERSEQLAPAPEALRRGGATSSGPPARPIPARLAASIFFALAPAAAPRQLPWRRRRLPDPHRARSLLAERKHPDTT